MLRRFVVLTGAALLLVGCGSQNSSSAVTVVDNLRSSIQAYDSSTFSDVSTTSAACGKAESSLPASANVSGALSGTDAALAHDLQQAYTLARAGFADCGKAAPFNYPLMARANTELTAANLWLLRSTRQARG